MTEEERSERRRRRAALLLIPVLLLGAAFCFWTLFASVGLGEAESFIPAPLGSSALANYGEDDIRGRLRSLSISIVEAVIRDRDPEEEDAGARATDVSESLKGPVPTVTLKPGDPTWTPMPPPTSTNSPVPTVTPMSTLTPSSSPFPSRTPTKTDVPTAGPTSTSGPSPVPSKTPTPSSTPPCKVPPYIEIIEPLPDQRFTLAEELPGQAFAFDPDNVDPVTCSTAAAIFPDDDGEGIVGDPEVEMRIEWWSGSSWVLMHTELENSTAYCPFGDIDPFCETHDLSTGEWPDSTPINTGKHRMKAKALQDDEGVSSGWVWVEFYIDPAPTPTPSNTPTPTPVPPTLTPSPVPPTPTNTPVPPTPTNTPTPVCPDFVLSWYDFGGSHVEWQLTNSGSSLVTLTRIELSWPTGGDMDRIKLDGSTIWNGNLASPADTDAGGSFTAVSRDFNPSDTKNLRLEISSSLEDGTFVVTVYSSGGCSASDSHFVDT